MPRRARRPDPPPLETNDAPIILVGTCLWAAGLVVLLVLRIGDLAEVRDWWMGMCVYGIVLGLIGLRYLRGRRTAATHDATAAAKTTAEPSPAGSTAEHPTKEPQTKEPPTGTDSSGAGATRDGATRS